MILQTVNKLLAFVNIDINFNTNETRPTERKLKLIKQKEAWDCPIACVAMVAGHSYKQVRTNLQKNYTNRGISCDTMMRYLKRHGIKTELERYEFAVVHLHAFVNAYDCTAILLLKNMKMRKGHFVVYDGKYIYDPEEGKIPAKEYIGMKWVVAKIELVV